MPAADVEYIESKLGVHPDFPIKGVNFVRFLDSPPPA